MNTINKIETILEAAETELKELAKDTLSRGNYSDVAIVTTLAKAISDLHHSLAGSAINNNDDSLRASNLDTQLNSTSEASMSRENLTRRSSIRSRDFEKSLYPRFERHAKRLVKLGWSSKDRRIYEQRTSFETVKEICKHFTEEGSNKKLLKIEDLLPMKSNAGEEIPSYQVYLVLKWLQQLGVVDRQGKDGYVVTQSDLDLKSLWEKTPAK